jgi:anti-sigma regulatory factor (Ser/Thr protein kinase)
MDTLHSHNAVWPDATVGQFSGDIDRTPARTGPVDHCELPLTAHPASIGRARAFTRTTFADAGCVDDGTAELVVSELVTNAIVHADEPISLHLWARPGRIRVAVSDATTTDPTRREPPLDSTGGRGLTLVERLALQWGSEPHPTGKLIWAEMECTDGNP